MWYTRNKKFPPDLLVVCLVDGGVQGVLQRALRFVTRMSRERRLRMIFAGVLESLCAVLSRSGSPH